MVANLQSILGTLTLPVVAAPMTGVSGPELVAAACLAGVIGSFPAHNASSHAELDSWLEAIEEQRQLAMAARTGTAARVAPIALNLVMRLKSRLEGDVAAVLKHSVPIVIASVGSPAEVIPPLRAAGTVVLADVASMRHVEKSLEAGADGLVLLTAGAGGNTGWVNPFAFVRAVRAEYDGPLVIAGGVCDGTSLFAARTLGCDLAFMGTPFIATTESRASDAYKRALVQSTLDHVKPRMGPEGTTANYLGDSELSAGHTVSCVRSIVSVAELVAGLCREFDHARSSTQRTPPVPA